MKIAIISDIHSNLEALKATLQDIRKREVDQIICLGDTIAKGVHAKECLLLLQENCDIILQGNCDDFFSSEKKEESRNSIDQKRIDWNQSLLTKQELEYLKNLPYCYEFYMSGSLVRLFHATPNQNDRAILNVDTIETKLSQFYPSDRTVSQEIADVVIYGHIHHAFMDKLYNKTLINVGSVGNSYNTIRNPKKDSSAMETTRSNYLILEGEFGKKEYGKEISYQFIQIAYPIEKELNSKIQNIEKEAYEYELKNGMYRDMKKVNENFRKLGINPDTI